MPLVVRQALAARLAALPEMRRFLADLSLLSEVTVRFWPAVPAPEAGGPRGGPVAGPEPVGFCARLRREELGCRLCVSFREKLRERAGAEPAAAECDAGLWELLVPVTVGGVVAGHFLASGLRAEPATAKADNRARHLLGRRGLELRAEEVARLRAGAPALEAAKREALGRLLQAGAERIARAIHEHLAAAPEGVPELVERAYRVVHAEYARRLRVPLLARRLGVSAAHLSRTFHHATGLRLVDYVARYRAERARTMLLDGGAPPVAEVGRACGFASVSQFNRVFRATFGASPRELRARPDKSLTPS
jgi:AraC-like DNA-binding protein